MSLIKIVNHSTVIIKKHELPHLLTAIFTFKSSLIKVYMFYEGIFTEYTSGRAAQRRR